MELNFVGKIFLASCAAWVLGKATNVKVRGTQEEIRSVVEALMSSRKFQEELNKPGASVASVLEKLKVKTMSAEQFERTFGTKWPI